MNHAELELTIAGREAEPLTAVYSRDLDFVDLETRKEPKHTTPVHIKKIRSRHRTLARHIASGMKQSEAAILVGMTDSRVSILLTDPMFIQLVGLYSAEVDKSFTEMNEKMANLGEDIIDNLQEKFDEDPESFTLKEQHELLKTLADRTGNGPATATQTVNLNIGLADRMETARNRVEANRMKDITPVESVANKVAAE